MGFVSPAIMIDALKREKNRRKAEGSLSAYMQQSWHILEPGMPFHDGWHLHAIAEHLEACLTREIMQLIINVPPRHMKSLQAACFFPSWAWIDRPEERFLYASYASQLSIRDSLKCRRLIESEWYTDRWGHRYKLIGDQNSKTFFENTRTGYRMATSVGASTTGHGGSIIVVDDPINALEATSEAILETTQEWWSQAMSTRLNDPKTGVKILVMQRLNEEDTTGHCLAEGGWEHLCLPAEFEPKRRSYTCIGWTDPRTEENELLWPEHFGRAEVDSLKKKLGTYGTAGQLQQRPAPEGGGILKEKYFQLWPANEPMPFFMFILQSWDTAYSDDKTINDPSALSVYGIFSKNGKNCAMLLDAESEFMEYPSLKTKAMNEYKVRYGEARHRVSEVLVEKKASGQSLVQDLRLAQIPVYPFNTKNASKVQRAHLAAPLHESCCVYIPESKEKPGEFVEWAQPFIKEVINFPAAAHDDYLDSYTQALIYFRDTSWLDIDTVEIVEEEDDFVDVQSSVQNPYAV